MSKRIKLGYLMWPGLLVVISTWSCLKGYTTPGSTFVFVLATLLFGAMMYLEGKESGEQQGINKGYDRGLVRGWHSCNDGLSLENAMEQNAYASHGHDIKL